MFENIKNLSSRLSAQGWLKSRVSSWLQGILPQTQPKEGFCGTGESGYLVSKGELKESLLQTGAVGGNIADVITSLKEGMLAYAPRYHTAPPPLASIVVATVDNSLGLVSPARIAELSATFHGEDYAVFRINKINSNETFAPTFAAEGLAA